MLRIACLLILSSCFVATWLNTRSAMGQDPRLELTSYLSANQAYWNSVRQFDVLVRTDVMRPPAISSGYVETSFERFKFDWETERFLYAKQGRRTLLSGDETQTVGKGLIIRDGFVRSFRNPTQAFAPTRVTDRNKEFDSLRIPDLRLTLFVDAGRGGGTWTDGKITMFETSSRAAEVVQRGAVEEDVVSLTLRFENRVGYTWTFDRETLCPRKGTWFLKKPDGDHMVFGTENYRYEDDQGIPLPISVVGEFLEHEFPRGIEVTKENVTQHLQRFQVNRDMRFAWISVNRPIPDEEFDFALMDSISDFLKLADPVAQGLPMLGDEAKPQMKPAGNDR